MASGTRRNSKPMFPSHPVHLTQRDLFLLTETGHVYNEDGKNMGKVPPEQVHRFLDDNNGMLFVSNFLSDDMEKYTEFLLDYDKAEIMCQRNGEPTMAHLSGRSPKWIVGVSLWDGFADIDFLKGTRSIFDYFGLGVTPTLGSLGRRSQFFIFEEAQLNKHTTLSTACEKYLFDHKYGGVVYTNRHYIGEDIRQASIMDETFAYVGKYAVQASGSGEYFTGYDEKSHYVTFFANVEVFVRNTLPNGIFPFRDDRNKVVYPTSRGVYNTHLWKETLDYLEERGIHYRIIDGWGWRRFTGDNHTWAEYIWWKRQNAPTDFLYKKTKQIGVAAIGRNGLKKEHYVLRADDKYDPETDFPVTIGRLPIELWVHPTIDNSASMIHWQQRTINLTNLDVVKFAFKYAMEDRLIAMDHDAVTVLHGEGDDKYIRKHSQEEMNAKVGDWIWMLHHDLHFWANRLWTSKEEPNRNGKLMEYVRNGRLIGV